MPEGGTDGSACLGLPVGDAARLLACLEGELRGPLSAIVASARTVPEVYTATERRELAQSIRQAARLLDDTFARLVDVARADIQSLALATDYVSLREALQECALVAGESSGFRGTATFSADVDADCVVRMDRRRFVQAIAGLVQAADAIGPECTDHVLTFTCGSEHRPPAVNLTPRGPQALRSRWKTLLQPVQPHDRESARHALLTRSTAVLLNQLGASLEYRDLPLSVDVVLGGPLVRRVLIAPRPPSDERSTPVLVIGVGALAGVTGQFRRSWPTHWVPNYSEAYDALRLRPSRVVILQHDHLRGESVQFSRHLRTIPTMASARVVAVVDPPTLDGLESARRYADAIALGSVSAVRLEHYVAGVPAADRRAVPRGACLL
jgi:hypothetical protein